MDRDAQRRQEAHRVLHRRSHRPTRPSHGPCWSHHLRYPVCTQFAGGKGAAKDKIAALEKAGIRVTNNPALLGKEIFKLMSEVGKLPPELHIGCAKH